MDYKDYNFNNPNDEQKRMAYRPDTPRRRPSSAYSEQRRGAPQPGNDRKPPRGTSPGLYMLIILTISIVISAVLLSAVNDVFAFVKKDVDTTITVTKDTTISGLSKELHKHDIINHRFLFMLFLKATHKDTNVLAGDYVLNPDMDYNAIVRNLKNAKAGTNTVVITIPEGYTVEQIRDELLTKHVCDDESALDKALTSYRYNYSFLKDIKMSKNWLEGYLFPDTYQFYVNDTAVNVVDKMLENFSKKYDSNIQQGAEKLGLSTNEVVTIASILEREAKVESEFAKISGVLHNRLNNSSKFPYLQVDATVQYAVGHKGALTSADLEVNSPYNTYKNKGLPPGPIASPGYTSLYAATHPDSHNYYYYVAMPDGSHLFAGTLSEHNANIEKSKTAFAAQGAAK